MRIRSLQAAVGLTVGLSLSVGAQTPSGGTLEEVITTARRTAENLQDTPVSVTTISGELLQEIGAVDLRSVTNVTPNMEFSYAGNGSGGGNFAQVFIRGVGQPDFIITKDPGVGIYVDGVYLARAPGSVLELLDVERIEVLRGPQGTLFGKNTIGGAVVVTTQRPSDELSGVAQVTLGSYHRQDLSGSLNLPLVPGQLALRVSAMSREQDGYYKRLYSTEDPAQFGRNSQDAGNDTNRRSGRATLLWTPSERFEAQLSADVTRERQNAVDYQMVGLPGAPSPNIAAYNQFYAIPNGLPTYGTQWISTKPWTSYSTWPGFNNSDIWGASLGLTWSFDAFQVKSITGYRDLTVETRGDGDGTPAEIVSTGGVDIKQHQFSQEIQFLGSAFNDRIDWVAGLWYFDETARDVQRSRQQAGLFEALEAAPLNSLIPAVAIPGCAAPCPLGGAGNPNNARLDNSRTGARLMQNTSYAVFLHGVFKFTDRFSMTAGARFSREEKEFDYYEVRPLRNIVSFDTYNLTPIPTDKWDIFTPKLGFEFKPNDDVLLYIQGSTGFKAGGYNGRPSNVTALQSFDEEELKTVEAGMKSEWLGNTLRANAAVFYTEYTDIQITRLSAELGGVRLEENAGSGKSKGFELELTYIPVPELRLGAALGYQDFEFTELRTGVQLACGMDCVLPFAPELTANLSVAYTFSLGSNWDLDARVDYKYSDKYYIDADNTDAVAQDSYDLVDARIALKPKSGAWELFVSGSNLTNEPIVANGVHSAPNNSQMVTYKPPRQWAAGVRLTF
jgi:iron complex outermembrane receptor protein